VKIRLLNASVVMNAIRNAGANGNPYLTSTLSIFFCAYSFCKSATCGFSSPSFGGISFSFPYFTGSTSQSPSVSLSGVTHLCMLLSSVLLMKIVR